MSLGKSFSSPAYRDCAVDRGAPAPRFQTLRPYIAITPSTLPLPDVGEQCEVFHHQEVFLSVSRGVFLDVDMLASD